MNISVDAMGGDLGPPEVILGAAQAASELDVDITLVGHKKVIEETLYSCPSSGRLVIQHCEEVVRMDEPPLKAVREKKDTSIGVAFELLRRGIVQAVVSAGNSGAMLAASIFSVGRLKGIERPGIAGIFPGKKGPVVVMDVGANVDCRASHLLEFGLMAHAFANSCLGVKEPRVGLLNIGREIGKGNDQVRLAYELLALSPLNFAGNVEGRDVFGGDVDVVICDGFVGNVVLKLSEGLGQSMWDLLEKEFLGSFWRRIVGFLMRGSVRKFQRILKYEEYGGAPMLGINGVGIVCHGASSARAIRNSVELAANYVNNMELEKISDQIGNYKAEIAASVKF